MAKKLSIGNKLYLSVLSLFLLFAVAFIVFQQYREKQYKVETLNLRLQDYNNQMHEALVSGGKNNAAWLNDYLTRHAIRDLRVTIINKDGRVIFDNVSTNISHMGNHIRRPEVRQALNKGNGSWSTEIARPWGTTIFIAPPTIHKTNMLYAPPYPTMWIWPKA